MENLKAGIYIQNGDGKVDALKNFGVLESILGETETSAASMASLVPYVFAAMDRRGARISEIEHEWRRGDEVTKDAPFPVQLRQLLRRTDEAMQLIGTAYWYKLRNGSGKLVGLRWLDPSSMTPDPNSIENPIGYTNYKRSTEGGEIDVLADDLFVFRKLGLREYQAGGIAGTATRLATEILYNLSQAENTLYKNPLPVSLIVVPQGTAQSERDRVKNFFWRVFNPSSKSSPENRVMPVFEGTEVQRISMTAEELDFEGGRQPNAVAVIAAHGVPVSEIFDDAANMATASEYGRSFTTRLGTRLFDIADVINLDFDMVKIGYTLDFFPERHATMQKDDLDVSNAFVNYGVGGLTPKAAAYLVGITDDDFPQDFGEVFATETEPIEETEAEPDEPIETKARGDLLKWRRKALRVGGWCEFESDNIPQSLAKEISGALKAQKTESGIKSLFSDYLEDEIPDEKEELNGLMDNIIKALQDDTPPPQPVTQVFNMTVKGKEGATPEEIAAEFAKAVSEMQPAQIVVNNEVPTPNVTVRK
jgi:hypothetical protein